MWTEVGSFPLPHEVPNPTLIPHVPGMDVDTVDVGQRVMCRNQSEPVDVALNSRASSPRGKPALPARRAVCESRNKGESAPSPHSRAFFFCALVGH
jgi:hypothetical protein